MMIYKYNGCGNDFILLDYDGVTDYSQLAIQLCGKRKFRYRWIDCREN